MTPSPDPPSPVGIRRRRKKRKDHSIPVIGWVVISICLLLVVAIAYIGSNTWHSRNGDSTYTSVAGDIAATSTNSLDFVLSKVARDDACRCIRGEVKNSSGKAYKEVQIYFELRGKDGQDLGTILAITGRVSPRGQASFATDNMPPGTETYKLKEIIGIT